MSHGLIRLEQSGPQVRQAFCSCGVSAWLRAGQARLWIQWHREEPDATVRELARHHDLPEQLWEDTTKHQVAGYRSKRTPWEWQEPMPERVVWEDGSWPGNEPSTDDVTSSTGDTLTPTRRTA